MNRLFDWLIAVMDSVSTFFCQVHSVFLCVVNLSVFVVVSVITDRAADCNVQMRQIR